VQSVLRRVAGPLEAGAAEVLSSGELRVDVAARDVSLAAGRCPLTLREFELLAYLMRHPKQAFTRQQLLQKRVGLHVR
jgi:DNA-binding response OmpR family regulator